MAFHWKIETVPNESLQDTLNALESKGFEVFSILPSGSDYSLKFTVAARQPYELHPTVLGCDLDTQDVRPTESVNLTYRWLGVPTEHRFHACVHIVNEHGRLAFQDDHEPVPQTTEWEGEVSYRRKVTVPAGTAAGQYRILVGLYDQLRYEQEDQADPPTLLPGEGVSPGIGGDERHCIGVLDVL